MKNTNYKLVRTAVFCLLGLMLVLIAACTTDEPADFGNENSNPVPNALPGAGQQAQVGGREWIKVDEVFGHKWKLTYDHGSDSALFEVAIVNWDEDRLTLTEVFYGCDYEFTNSKRSGDEVLLELDSLKASIEDCYDRAGATRTIDRFESYAVIQFEITGSFQQPANGPVIKHPSFNYGIERSGSRVGVKLSANGSNGQIEGESDTVQASGGIADFNAASNLDFCQSADDPNVQMSYLEHYLLE